MSDILKEIYIKQAQRQKTAGTESEKIASLNAAYAQAQKVKKQRQINDQRQKAGALQVQSIEQNTAAKGALQKATEEISLAQEQRDARYNLYMDLTSKGIYDPNAAAALSVSKKTYDRVLAKVQAARAPKVTAKATNDVVAEENEQEQEPFDPKNVTYSQQQAAHRRAMNDDVDGDGQRGKLSDDKRTQREIAAIESKTALDTKSASALHQASGLASKHNVSADHAARVVLNLMGVGVEKKGAQTQNTKSKEKFTDNGTKYYDLSNTKYRAVKDPQEYLGMLVNDTIKKAESGEPVKLNIANQIFLEVYSDSKSISEVEKQNIGILRSVDTLGRVKEYTEYLGKLGLDDLHKEMTSPNEKFQMSTSVKKGMAESLLYEKQVKIRDDAVKEFLGADADYNIKNANETLTMINGEIDELVEIVPVYDHLQGMLFTELWTEKMGEIEGTGHDYKKLEEETRAAAQSLAFERVAEQYAIISKYGLTTPADVYDLQLKREQQRDILNGMDSTAYVTGYQSAMESDEEQTKKWIEEGKKLAGNLTVEYQVDERGKSYLTMTAGEGVIGTGWRHIKNTSLYALTVALAGGLPVASEAAFNYVSRKANPDLEDNFASYNFKLEDLTEEEKEVLYYFLGRYGGDEQKAHNNEAESAFAYLDSIADEVMMRKARESVSDSAFYESIKRLHDGVAENVNNLALNITKNVTGMQSKYTAPSSYRWEAAKEKHDMDKWYETAAGDVLYAIGDQIPRVVVTAALNYVAPAVGSFASTALFATQTAAQDLNDKIAEGWDTADALGYTVLNTAFQTVSEKMFNAFGVGEQMGFVTKAFKKQIEKAAKKAGGKLVLEVFSNLTQEGFEEMIQNVGEQVLNSAFDPEGNLIEDFDLEGMLYDGLIGALTGAAGTAPQVAATTIDVGRGAMQQRTQNRLKTTSSEELKSEIVSASKTKEATAHAYDVVYNAAQSGLPLDAARKLAGQINRLSRKMGKPKVLEGRDINRAYAMGKVDFKATLSGAARASYEKCGTNIAAQNAWITLYNAGYAGAAVENFTGLAIPVKEAKVAYGFGQQAAVDEQQNNLYNENTNGGIENGSENTGEMEETGVYRGNDGVWQQGDDTQRYAKGLDARTQSEERNGRAWRGHPKSTGGWLAKSKKSAGGGLRVSQRILGDLRGKRLSNKDTAGRTLSPEQRNKYAHTVLKDENGNLISLYHWTDKIFNRFAVGDIGFHFGTFFAAEEHRNERIGKSKTGRSIYKEVYLNIQNPILIYFDAVEWDARNTVHELLELGVLDQNEAAALQKLDGYDLGGYDCEALVALRQLLTDKGYDGIVYFNESEDAGSLSVIAFSPDQIEIVQDIEETQSGPALDEDLAKELFIAGMNGVPMEQAADIEGATEQEQQLMQTAYENGKSRRSRLGTAEGAYRKGEGKVFKNTGRRFGVAADVAMMRKFARTHNLDVEILDDGSINGKAAYDVAAYRILMSKSSGNEHFYHEVFENMLAISPKVFDQLERSMIEHYLKTHSLTELEDRIATYMSRYDTEDYALGRKEWVCSYAAKLLDTAEGRHAFFDWLHSHDKTRTLGQRIIDFFRRIGRAIKRAMNGDWIGTAQKRKGAKLSAEIEGIIALLEENRVYQASLKDGQKITLGGGESAVRYAALSEIETDDEVYNRLGWTYNILSPEDMHIVQQQIAEAGIQGYQSFCKFTDSVTNQTMLALAANNNIVIVNDDFEFPVIYAVVSISKMISTDNSDILKDAKEFYDAKYKSQQRRSQAPFREFIKAIQAQVGKTYTLVHERTNYISAGANRTRRNQGTGTHRNGGTSGQNSGGMQYGRRNNRKDVRVVGAHDNDNGTITVFYSNGDQRVYTKGTKGNIRYSLDTTEVSEEKVAEKKRRLPSTDAKAIGVNTARMDEMARNGGKLPQGERVKRDIAVPRKVNGKKTMRWARTFFESGVGEPEMVDPVAEELLEEGLSYKAISNESAFNEAERVIEQKGYEGAIRDLESMADNGQFSKNAAALGQLLLKTAAEAKDHHNFKKLVVLISEMGTQAGQTVQALSMLKRMDGETKLFAVQRLVNKLNRELSAGKYGSKNTDMRVSLEEKDKTSDRVITVDPQLIQRLLETAEDADASSAIVTEIYKDIGRQLPRGKFEDGWNAWRYLSMLSSPTTHVRNVTGNVAFMPMVGMKNSLKRVGELLLIRDGGERTAKILPASKKARQFAKEDALKMETILKSGGKYNEADVIDQIRKKLPGFLDKLEKGNSAAMEWEDWQFLRFHYSSTLARYLDANKIDPENITAAQLNRARDYATKEAMKATYRDGSRLAASLNSFSREHRIAGKILEGVLPFKKTPINVLKRGIEYSPLGLIRTMTLGAYNAANKKITVNEWLDGFCAGLSGTMILSLGAFACALGLVQGGFGRDDDDPEDKAQDDLKRLSGLQEYSIRIGNFSYTIDWAAPAAIPFFMGVEMAEAFREEDGNLWDRIWDAIVDGADVIINTSMLDGLQGTIDSIKYESGSLVAIAENAIVNYVTQAIPSVFGKHANLFDGTRRSNYVDPDSKVPETLQRIGNKLAAKVPGLSGLRNAYVDEFGREQTEENWALRFFQNFISPGYYSEIRYGELEEMMSEIYANAEDPSIIPTTASKSFMLNGERVYLSAREYEQFAKERGKIAYEIMTQMIDSDNFDRLSYDEMQEVLKKAYEYSGAVAKSNVSDYELDDWQAQAAKLEKKGVAVSDFILYKHVTSNEKYKREDVLKQLQRAGLSYYEARRYISSIQTKYKRGYEDEGISVDVTVGAAIDMEKGDYSDYQSAVDRIISMGHTEEDAIKAIHSEAGIGGDYVEGTIYTSGDLYNAVVTDSDFYATVYNSLVNAKVKGGSKQSAAKTSVKSGLSRRFRNAYEKGNGETRAQIKEQMIRSGLYGTNGNVQRIIYDWSKEFGVYK